MYNIELGAAQKRELLTMYSIVMNDTLTRIYEHDNDLLKFLNDIATQYNFKEYQHDMEKWNSFQCITNDFEKCNCGTSRLYFMKKYHSKWIQCPTCDNIFKIQ